MIVHVCARFECPKFSTEHRVSGPLNPLCFVLVFEPNLGAPCLEGGEGLVGHFWPLSATFPPCRPLEVVGRLGEVAGRPPKVANGHFSPFSNIFFASCWSLIVISIHVYGGMNTSLGLYFYIRGGLSPIWGVGNFCEQNFLSLSLSLSPYFVLESEISLHICTKTLSQTPSPWSWGSWRPCWSF